MDLKIIEKKEEPLLSRTRIFAEISFDSTPPKKTDVQSKVASLQKVSESLIVVKDIKTIFGTKSAKTVCYQYQDEKKLKLVEPKVKIKKKKEEPKEEKKEAKEEAKN